MAERDYKDSGIDWIGRIPKHWEVRRLKHLVSLIKSGGTPTSSNADYYSDEGTPWVIIEDMSTTDVVFDTANKLSAEGLASKNLVVHPEGTILYSIYATIGKVSRLAIPAAINQAILALYQKDDLISASYFTAVLKSLEPVVLAEVSSNTQKNLSANKVANFVLPLPPLEEQEAIVAYLEERCAVIDSIIAKRQEAITLLGELRSSLISRAVTRGLDAQAPTRDSGIDWLGHIPTHWEVRPFKALFSSSKGLSITKENLVDEGIPVISYGQIHSTQNPAVRLDSTLFRFVESSYLATGSKSLVSQGDFVFADTSEDIDGAGNYIHINEQLTLFAGYHTIIAKTKERKDNSYLAYLFQSNEWRSQIRSRVSGVKVYSITQQILFSTSVILPPLEEQEAIVAFLEAECAKLDARVQKLERHIALLEELKQKLISDATTGKLDIRH